MHTLLSRAVSGARRGAPPVFSDAEALELALLPPSERLNLFAAAGLVRGALGPKVFTCGILNAKSGRCPEDCAFCAQSAHHRTASPVYPLRDADVLLRRAGELAAAGALRFGIVTSGTALADAELDALCDAALRLRREVGIALCVSPGQVTPERARRLRQAGFSSYHHNLETAASHFPAICTTHAYEADLESLRAARAAGLRICSCGIFGLGETWAQRVELARTLEALEVDSLPLNFLIPIPGTPLQGATPLRPEEALHIIALMRLLHPRRDIVVCGGRTKILGPWQSWLFQAGANGLMTGNYLTTTGNDFAADAALMAVLGLGGAV